MTLQKYISHPSLVLYLFPNPTHKTETRTANMWGTLLIATHLMIQSNVYLVQSAAAGVLGFGVPFTSSLSKL
jgi:hypothetical protein